MINGKRWVFEHLIFVFALIKKTFRLCLLFLVRLGKLNMPSLDHLKYFCIAVYCTFTIFLLDPVSGHWYFSTLVVVKWQAWVPSLGAQLLWQPLNTLKCVSQLGWWLNRGNSLPPTKPLRCYSQFWAAIITLNALNQLTTFRTGLFLAFRIDFLVFFILRAMSFFSFSIDVAVWVVSHTYLPKNAASRY